MITREPISFPTPRNVFQRMGQIYYAAHRSAPEESQAANVQAVLDALPQGWK